jgi:hypothetical protein
MRNLNRRPQIVQAACGWQETTPPSLRGPRMTSLGIFLLLLLGAILAGSPAFAQQSAGSIAGVVRDGSGAVLPGVQVEASSPALIEKVRTATTDQDCAYRIVDLRPGTYSVTFYHDVQGASPLIDVQSTVQNNVISRTALTAVPTFESYGSVGQLIPGNYPPLGTRTWVARHSLPAIV